MPALDFGLSSYERGRGDMPPLPVINMFVEEAPTEEKGVILQSRPGLEDREADMGDGPVRQLFKRDLVLDTTLFGVSGGELYRETTSLGTIDGDGPVSIAGYENFLFTAAGASLWGFDGATLAAIAFPDIASVLKVIIAASRAICIRADTGKFYWSDALEDDIEALDFATAENQPDRLLDMLFIDGILRLFGAETVEPWPLTTDASLPFQPLPGSVIERGIKTTGCATAIGSTFAWVTNLNEVCLTDENNVISNEGLQAKIAASTACSLFTFVIDGVEFLALRLTYADETGETQTWSLRNRTWAEFQSYGEANWIPQCYTAGVFGSSADGKTLAWSDAHEDLDGFLERRFRAGFRPDRPVTVSNLRLGCNVGQAVDLSGDYVNPQIERRISLNHGKSWGEWKAKPLGTQGAFATLVQWLAMGMSRLGFGWLVEFRITDPVDFRVSSVRVNDPFGGR
jgi:hypothetical protein